MTVTRRSSINKRLERLEAARRKQAESAYRGAFVVLGAHEGETHLEMTGSDGGQCWFQVCPGPGPQISDFGQFAFVLHMTEAEAEA